MEKRAREPLPSKDLVLPGGMSTFLMCTGDHGNYNKLDTEPQVSFVLFINVSLMLILYRK